VLSVRQKRASSVWLAALTDGMENVLVQPGELLNGQGRELISAWGDEICDPAV
jgi:hypothetical protein